MAAATTGMMSTKEMRDIFNTAGGGAETVTFDQATRLDGVDGVLEEEAATLEELLLLWGDESTALDFDGFSKWYEEVLKLYDEYLWKDAVAPPSAAFDDELYEEEEIEYTDEELLEDMPTQNQMLSSLRPDKEVQEEQMAAKAAAPTRENVEVTRLFREGCDENNRLSFEALCSISEIDQLLEEEEMTQDELEDMWDALPRKNDTIDVLAFRDLMGKIDDLFEFVEEEEGVVSAGSSAVAEQGARGGAVEVLDASKVKATMMATIDSLLDREVEPCGLSGSEETDLAVHKSAAQLEKIWRQSLDYMDEFEVTPIIGEWELIYSTSAKWRRWQSVLNTGDKFIPKGKFDGLVQSFSVVEGSLSNNEYDMEEVFINDDGQELGIRGVGTWSVYVQDNVVTALEDLVLRVQMQSVEYDTKDDDVKQAEDKILESQMCRTFSYSYLCYIDEDTRVMRTGLTDKSFFIFKKLVD